MQKIGFSGRKEFLYLLGLDRSLQNHTAGAKVAAPGGVGAVLTDVSHRLLEHAAAALRTGTERSQPRKIHLCRGVTIRLAPEVELGAKLGRKPYHCGERFSDPAAEARQRVWHLNLR